MDLLQKHPELLRIKQDQLTLSPAVAAYLDAFNHKLPRLTERLKNFRQQFSSLTNPSSEQIASLCQEPAWTHTQAQRDFACGQLQRVVVNYPIAQELRGKVSRGLYLDLRKEVYGTKFLSQLNDFIQQVVQLDPPPKIAINTDQLGKFPLVAVHASESDQYVDPLLSGKLDRVWTLDVSLSPGLSIKDVITWTMVEDAVKNGEIRQETVLVEGTSGNTGAGLAIEAARRSLKLVLTIPDKMSREKINRICDYGAHVVVTPTKVEASDPRSYYSIRSYIREKTNGWQANQYDNLSNMRSHEKITGPQIWEQTEGRVTAVVATAGTCGTISGIGRYLKQQNKKVKIIAVDSIGSILYLLKKATISQPCSPMPLAIPSRDLVKIFNPETWIYL